MRKSTTILFFGLLVTTILGGCDNSASTALNEPNPTSLIQTSSPIMTKLEISPSPIAMPAIISTPVASSVPSPVPTLSAAPSPTNKTTPTTLFIKTLHDVNVVNEWKGSCFNRICVFDAGAMKNNVKDGVLMEVFKSDKSYALYHTPKNHGSLHITDKGETSQLHLKSEDGTTYVFDFRLSKFVKSSENLSLSIKPGIFFPDSELKDLKGHEPELQTTMNLMKALLDHNLELLRKQFINPEIAKNTEEYMFNDVSTKYAFQQIKYWGNKEKQGERCMNISASSGDTIRGEVRNRPMLVCMNQNDQKDWKISMID